MAAVPNLPSSHGPEATVGSDGDGIVSCMQPNSAHLQIEFCVLACHLRGLISNVLWTEGWGPLPYGTCNVVIKR